MEEMEQRKKDKEAAAAAAAASTTPSYAPDYAAGLISPAASVGIVGLCALVTHIFIWLLRRKFAAYNHSIYAMKATTMSHSWQHHITT